LSKRDYYSEKLSADRLKRCYDIATPRIKQYLEAEISYVLDHIKPADVVLELGCGYGRVLTKLAEKSKVVYGIDTSKASINLARAFLADYFNIRLIQMNAKSLTFEDNFFDVVVVIQNGISAFKIDPRDLIKESLRVTKKGGKIIISSYSDKIWNDRLEWFISQSKEGLLGEIDFEKSKNGLIVCTDGFVATTYTQRDFLELISELSLNATVEEVDQSSIFCIIEKSS
jgi:2-polyprenyl-6-hydroxyphenyl methylase/3-demethylubiquinone-9 3-methyltransferase